MRLLISGLFTVFVLSCTDSGDGKRQALTCDDANPCPPGQVCDPATGTCLAVELDLATAEADLAAPGPDLAAPAADLSSPAADLAQAPDLSGPATQLTVQQYVTGTGVGPKFGCVGLRKMGAGGTVTSSVPGIDCGAACSAPFPEGTVVVLKAVPDSKGYAFQTWGGACSGSGTSDTCTLTLRGAKADVTATFLRTQCLSVGAYNVGGGCAVKVNPPGRTCTSLGLTTVCNYELDRGTMVQLEALPATGFRFTGWTGTCSGTNKICDLVISGDTQTTASFSR